MDSDNVTRLLGLSLWIAATALGSSGVFFVWASFFVPLAAVYAVLCLGLGLVALAACPRPAAR